MRKKYSYFRKAEEDEKALRQWVKNLEEVNGFYDTYCTFEHSKIILHYNINSEIKETSISAND